MSTFEERLAKLEGQSPTYVQFKIDSLGKLIATLKAENEELRTGLGEAAILLARWQVAGSKIEGLYKRIAELEEQLRLWNGIWTTTEVNRISTHDQD